MCISRYKRKKNNIIYIIVCKINYKGTIWRRFCFDTFHNNINNCISLKILREIKKTLQIKSFRKYKNYVILKKFINFKQK